MDLSLGSRESSLGPRTAEKVEEEEESLRRKGNKRPDDIDLRSATVSSHTEAVQALRKYLLRKMSSDESPGDKDVDYIHPGRVISVAEADGSKLYCSLVQRPEPAPATDEAPTGQQGNKRCLLKHKSLDLTDSSSSSTLYATALPHPTTEEESSRYLRTDLCIPVLWSKCSFCDDFFENEEQLRKHLRDSHFQYFLNYIQMRPLTSTKSLSDLPFSSALQISDSATSSPNSETGGKSSKTKSVRCQVCQKSFTTKWNCKQHLKCHAKETNVSAASVEMMETTTDPSDTDEVSPQPNFYSNVN